MYAVIATGGKQYRVEKGSVLRVEKLAAEPGSAVKFDQVLMVGAGDSVKVGSPLLVVHGSEDRLIRPELGRALFEQAGVPKRFVLVQGGTHYSTNGVGQALYRDALRELFRHDELPAEFHPTMAYISMTEPGVASSDAALRTRTTTEPGSTVLVYVDDAAKPELLLAISPFEVFVGLRPHPEVAEVAAPADLKLDDAELEALAATGWPFFEAK